MSDTLAITINGRPLHVVLGTSVAAAILIARQPSRISVSGEPRVALCGMGICFECRAVVNDVIHRRTCQMACAQGMIVESDR